MSTSQGVIDRRRMKQLEQVNTIFTRAKQIAELVVPPTVQCCGTQPSRASGVGHKKCGKILSIQFAFQCYYCGFWFCPSCAAEHFGKSRTDHVAEFDAFDGTIYE